MASIHTKSLIAAAVVACAWLADAAPIDTNPVTLVGDVVPLTHFHPAFGAAVPASAVAYTVERSENADASEGTVHAGRMRTLEATSKDIQRLQDHFKTTMITSYKTLQGEQYKSAAAPIAPWPSSYWPIYNDGINARWDKQEKSPSEKYALAFGKDVKQFMDTMSRSSGILSQINRRKCSATPECDSLKDGSICGKREGEASGYCIPGWFGICHAWAPAAILEAEPKCAVQRGNVTFQPFDIKALITQLYDGASIDTVFTGARFNGRDQPAPMDQYGRYTDASRRDLGAGYFHIAISNIMGKFKQSFVVDVTAGAEVWNQPVRRYTVLEMKEMGLKKAATDFFKANSYPFNSEAKKLVYVKTKFEWMVEAVEDGPLVTSGRIDSFTQSATYEYLLELNNKDDIIGGEWVGESRYNHPDFLWFATEKPASDTETNVGLKYSELQKLLDESVKCATPVTPAPTTPEPTTPAPTTPEPTTPAPTTPEPTTPAPTTPEPTTPAPTTPEPTTPAPTTPEPTTPAPTTPEPTTPTPTTPEPTTPAPTTPEPTTPAPTTPEPTTPAPTSEAPTPAPTTVAPVTSAPTPSEPTTEAPTPAPTTVAPVTSAPTPSEPTTEAPTPAPTTVAPVTSAPTPSEPTTEAPTPAPTTVAPVTSAPTPSEPTTEAPTPAPTTVAPVTSAPTPSEPTTEAPTPAPTTVAPVTSAPTPSEPTTEAPTPAPTTVAPVTSAPTPSEPTTEAPTPAPTTVAPVTSAPTPSEPTTEAPTPAPTTVAPVTSAPTPSEPTTEAPTPAPTSPEPTTSAPTTPVPTTSAPTTFEPGTLAPATPEPTTLTPITTSPSTLLPTTPAPTTVTPTAPPSGQCGTVQVGVDFYGDDIRQVQRARQSDCCAVCAKTPDCKAYTFVRGTCFLKSGKGKLRAHPHATSAVLTPANNGQQQQQRPIDTDATCKNQVGSTCGNEAVGAQCCPTGSYCHPQKPWLFQCRTAPARCPAQQVNVAFHGANLKSLSNITADKCCDACTKTNGCKAYTFYQYTSNGRSVCHLKSGQGSPRFKNGAVSATVTASANTGPKQWY